MCTVAHMTYHPYYINEGHAGVCSSITSSYYCLGKPMRWRRTECTVMTSASVALYQPSCVLQHPRVHAGARYVHGSIRPIIYYVVRSRACLRVAQDYPLSGNQNVNPAVVAVRLQRAADGDDGPRAHCIEHPRCKSPRSGCIVPDAATEPITDKFSCLNSPSFPRRTQRFRTGISNSNVLAPGTPVHHYKHPVSRQMHGKQQHLPKSNPECRCGWVARDGGCGWRLGRWRCGCGCGCGCVRACR